MPEYAMKWRPYVMGRGVRCYEELHRPAMKSNSWWLQPTNFSKICSSNWIFLASEVEVVALVEVTTELPLLVPLPAELSILESSWPTEHLKKDLPLPFSCSVVSFLCLHPSLCPACSCLSTIGSSDSELASNAGCKPYNALFVCAPKPYKTCTAKHSCWTACVTEHLLSEARLIRGGSKGQLNPEVLVAPCLKRATSCELFSGIALTSGATSVLSPPLPQKQNRQRRIHKARSAPPINERAYPQGPWLTPWGKWERGAQT